MLSNLALRPTLVGDYRRLLASEESKLKEIYFMFHRAKINSSTIFQSSTEFDELPQAESSSEYTRGKENIWRNHLSIDFDCYFHSLTLEQLKLIFRFRWKFHRRKIVNCFNLKATWNLMFDWVLSKRSYLSSRKNENSLHARLQYSYWQVYKPVLCI